VTALAAGAADATEVSTLDAASAVEPCSTSRLENIGLVMVVSSAARVLFPDSRLIR
jgi:hypothetical protein